MNSIYSENLSFVISNTHVGETFTIRYCENLCEALVLNESKEGKIVQILLSIFWSFDDKSNVWKKSDIRKWLNSYKFLKEFDESFLNLIKETEVHTEDYVTKDKFWLLSHEEVGYENKYGVFNPNKNTRKFDYFDGSDEKRCVLNDVIPCGWWLRSVSSGYSYRVGLVYNDGYVCNYNADIYYSVLPACLIN
jgi:hypothetical protein